MLHHDLGRLAEANRIYSEVLNAGKGKHGIEHPDTLNALHNVALVCSEQGERIEASRVFRVVHSSRIKILGDLHMHTLETSFCLVENVVGILSVLDDVQAPACQEECFHELVAVCQHFGDLPFLSDRLFQAAIALFQYLVDDSRVDEAVEVIKLVLDQKERNA